jgi:membrane protease YdiL (CAAX protease family)
LPVRKIVSYAIATAIAAAGIISQYLIPSSWFPPGISGFVLDLFLVYGFGLMAFYIAFDTRPIRNFLERNKAGAREGFRWYGIFVLMGLLLAFALTAFYLAVDSSRYWDLMHKATNIQNAGASDPLFYILFSIFFVGFVEETLFRGYILGSLLTIVGTRNWRTYAVLTSLLFAGVHIYYAQTYMEVSPIYYAEIAAMGLAFSYTYVLSGGNILVIALLHGGYDALSFFSLTPLGKTDSIALVMIYVLLLASALWALSLYLRNPDSTDQWDGAAEVPPECWPPVPRPGYGQPAAIQ